MHLTKKEKENLTNSSCEKIYIENTYNPINPNRF